MISFVVHTVPSGEIISTGASSSMNDANMQARAGQAILLVPSLAGITPQTHIVLNAGDDDVPCVLAERPA